MSTSASPMTAADVVDDDDVVKDIAATAKTTTRSMSLFERGPQSLGHFSTGPSMVEKVVYLMHLRRSIMLLTSILLNLKVNTVVK